MKNSNTKATDKFDGRVEELFVLVLKTKERLSYIKGVCYAQEPEIPQLRDKEIYNLMATEKTTLVRHLLEIIEDIQKIDL